MKHFLILLALALLAYGIWSIATKKVRREAWKRTRRHIAPVVVIVLLLLFGLLAMFRLNGINLL